MISEEDIAKTISIFEGYLSGGPEVIEEVENLLNQKGFHLSLPKEDARKATLVLFNEIFRSIAIGTSYDSTMKLMIAVGVSLLIKMIRKRKPGYFL